MTGQSSTFFESVYENHISNANLMGVHPCLRVESTVRNRITIGEMNYESNWN